MNKQREDLFDYVVWAKRVDRRAITIGIRNHLNEDRYECTAANNPLRFMRVLIATRNRWQLIEPKTEFVIALAGANPFGATQ